MAPIDVFTRIHVLWAYVPEILTGANVKGAVDAFVCGYAHLGWSRASRII